LFKLNFKCKEPAENRTSPETVQVVDQTNSRSSKQNLVSSIDKPAESSPYSKLSKPNTNTMTPPVPAFGTPVNRRLKVLRRTGNNFSPIQNSNNSANASPVPINNPAEANREDSGVSLKINWPIKLLFFI